MSSPSPEIAVNDSLIKGEESDPIPHDHHQGSHVEHLENSKPAFEADEGVEVVLDHGNSKVILDDSPERHGPSSSSGDQNVFRGPPPPSHHHHSSSSHHRPRPKYPPGAPPPQNMHPSSGSFGYGPPPPPGGQYPPPPHGSYPSHVPYAPSGSFDYGSDHHHGHHHQTHYSPQVHYPPPGGHHSKDQVNVISPNHKGDPHYRPPPPPPGQEPPTPHSRGHYNQYPPTSPPRSSHGSSRSSRSRRDGPYSAAQRGEPVPTYHPDDGTFNAYSHPPPDAHGPPIVTDPSFESEHYSPSHPGSHYSSHPPTPASHYDHRQFYEGGGSWHSFDSGHPPPPHFDDHRYYGYPPESPYSHYSPGGYYPPPHPHDPYHYDRGYGEHPPHEHGHPLLKDYHPDRDGQDGRDRKGAGKDSKSGAGILLPQAASEVDFEVTNPPSSPVVPPSTAPVCESLSGVFTDDVLCGRGGGTNSQVGNRRFRKLVQDFQPTYLLARRKEKPLLARTIVLIIRKRGGRFLKKNEETGELYEVGDAKAEAKTSQALREGLDVRATKSAASNLLDKKKKKKAAAAAAAAAAKAKEEEQMSPASGPISPPGPSSQGPPPPVSSAPIPSKVASPGRDVSMSTSKDEASQNDSNDAPPSPKPQVQAGMVHPHSPESIVFNKRRRFRSKEDSSGCAPCPEIPDKLFLEFCPPKADLQRTASPTPNDDPDTMELNTPPHRNSSQDQDDNYRGCGEPAPGCTDIAMMSMMGAATGSFCLGPTKWRNSETSS